MGDLFITAGTILIIAAFAVLMYIGLSRSALSRTKTKALTDELDNREIKLIKVFVALILAGFSLYFLQFVQNVKG